MSVEVRLPRTPAGLADAALAIQQKGNLLTIDPGSDSDLHVPVVMRKLHHSARRRARQVLAMRSGVSLSTADDPDSAAGGCQASAADAVDSSDAAAPLSTQADCPAEAAEQSTGLADAPLQFWLPAPVGGLHRQTRGAVTAAEAAPDMQRFEIDERQSAELAGLGANFAAQLMGARIT